MDERVVPVQREYIGTAGAGAVQSTQFILLGTLC